MRFLCFTLLFLIALPVSAQEEPPTLGQSLPRDPALLMQMRDQLSYELRDTQRALGFINPNDTQLVEVLKTRQADFERRIGDITKQLQTPSPPNISEMMLQGRETRRDMPPMPPGLLPVQPPVPMRPEPDLRQAEPGMMGGMTGGMPVGIPVGGIQSFPSNGMSAAPMGGGISAERMGVPFGNHSIPMDVPSNAPQWGNQTPTWDHWGPRLPRELTEVKRSVDSLQKEIVELRETVKSLETQIQLLNRTILLSEQVNERRVERNRVELRNNEE